MAPSTLESPRPEKANALWRLVIHGRTLVIVHIAAVIGTGFEALALNPTTHVPRRVTVGAIVVTLVRMLWVGWPFLASLAVSRSQLPGKRLAIWLFLMLLAAVTIIGGIFLATTWANKGSAWDVLQIEVVEAVLLMIGARLLGLMELGR
jgi:hypothetical protein